MEVLVVGGTGFLSSAVVEELRAAGHEVTIYTRGRRQSPEGVRSLVGDRKDPEAFVRSLEGVPFDAVVDCICYTPNDVEMDLRAFSGRVSRLVMISTDFVYGPERVLPMDEETPTRALSQYGRNKAASEARFFQAWLQDGFPVTVLRPPHIMGAGGQLGSGSLQGRDPMLLDRLEQRAPTPLLDGGALLVQPVVHRDVGRACHAALGSDAAVGQAYNVAGPDAVTTKEYYDLIAAVLGVEDPEYLFLPSAEYVRAFPERAPFAFHRTYSVEKLARDTGFRPSIGLRHAVFEMIDWLQANEMALPYQESEQDASLAALCRAFGEELGKILVC